MDNTPIVTIKNNKEVVANSRDVAAYFNKLHKDVLKAIDLLILEAPSIERDFAPIEIDTKVGFGTRKDRAFEMTREGFTLLAMGFTGKKALQFKLRYIEQFNKMEAMLKEMNTPDVVTATEIRSLQTHFDTRLVEMERRLMDQLVRMMQSSIQAPSSAAVPSIPTADDLKPTLKARLIATFDFVPHGMTNQEIGLALSDYSRKHGYKIGKIKDGPYQVHTYCPAAVRGCFGVSA